MIEKVSKTERTAAPRRFLALWFPFLTTDRLHRERAKSNYAKPDKRPLVAVEKIKGHLRIAAVDQRASELGLKRGLTLADARARIPDIAVAEADNVSDERLIERLAEQCYRFTPSVALNPPDGLMLDISGCAHLFAGEANLRAKVSAVIWRFGVSTRSSIAGTPDAACALARFSTVEIAPPGKDEELVRRLPVVALAGQSHETIVALSRAGLKTIGDVAERPAQVLAARFGQYMVTSLMQTLGRELAPISALKPLPAIVIDRQFAEPFTHIEALEAVLSELLADAIRVMQERDEGGRAFNIIIFRSDGAIKRLSVQTGRPSRDADAILRLFHDRIQSLSDPLDPGFGFDCIRLTIDAAETLNAAQPHLDACQLDEIERQKDAVCELIDRLSVRFGGDRVLRFQAINSHDPDRDARLVYANNFHDARLSAASHHALWHLTELGEPPLRPLQLFKNPQVIEVLAEVPDGPPMRFRWRRVLHEVAHAEGPERIAPVWHDQIGNQCTRDYFRVEVSDGCRFWIFRQGQYGEGETDPRWYLHGVFA